MVHEDAPEEEECVPAPHAVHADDDEGEYVPTSHATQVVDDDAPTALECVPALHAVQDVDDDNDAEYDPASHMKQVLDAGASA